MHSIFRIAQWALCVCLFATLNFEITNDDLVSKVEARPKKRKGKRIKAKGENIRRCMKFNQKLGADGGSVEMTLTSNCRSEVVCNIEWDVICSADSNAAPTSEISRSTTMVSGEIWEQSASASVCESDWQIGSVQWNCVAATSGP